MGFRWNAAEALQWTAAMLRWPDVVLSSLLPFRFRWPVIEFSIVDNVLWPFVTAFESVALVSMLGFFFLFCGCTL